MEPATVVPNEELTTARWPLLVFFDGECAFCDRWANRIKAADRGRRIRYGTKQGTTFQRVAKEHPELLNVESIVLARRRAEGGDDFLVRTAAVREIVRDLPGFRFFAFVLRILPTPACDFGYRIFSKVRKPLFGRLTQCRVPTEEEKNWYVD